MAIDNGKRLSETGDPAGAARSFEQALALDPDNAEIHFRLGLAARDQRRLAAAATHYRRAIELRPDYVEAHNNLGAVLQMQDDSAGALAAWRRAVALQPDFGQPYLNLGRMLASLGDNEQAAATFRAAIERGIEAESFRHLLNALDGETTVRAPDAYTRNLFDHFAADFDRRLVDELGYRIPAVLAARIKALQPRRDLRVLDLGCGTGLCGVQLAGCCKSLTGIDLSPAMLEKARARNLYDALVDCNIVDWLEQAPADAFDVVLAADVFIYCGELTPLFAACARVMASGGLFGFSIEVSAAQDVFLQPSGRYAHSADYIRRLCAQYGLQEADHFAHRIRGDIGGQVFILRKP